MIWINDFYLIGLHSDRWNVSKSAEQHSFRGKRPSERKP